MDDHAVALAELRGRCGEGAPAGYGDGDVFEIVSYREVGGSCASGVDFGDLAADPCRRPFLHGGVEFLAQHAYRPGVFRSGFACQSWQLVERTGYRCAGHVRVLVHGNHYRCGVESSCDFAGCNWGRRLPFRGVPRVAFCRLASGSIGRLPRVDCYVNHTIFFLAVLCRKTLALVFIRRAGTICRGTVHEAIQTRR